MIPSINQLEASRGRSAARIACITILALSASLLSQPSVAAPASFGPAQVTVSYADLDITRVAGAETLYRRIVAAAARVCPQSNPKALRRNAAMELCAKQALARAVVKVDSAALSRYYASKRGSADFIAAAR
jgi:UrcA family protein